MPTQTIARKPSTNVNASPVKGKGKPDIKPLITLKGKGKASRELAFNKIAPLSFVEGLSRAESIENMRMALGNKPSEAETTIARTEWLIGRAASRMPAAEFPAGTHSSIDKLEATRLLITRYAAPPKEGTKPRKLRKDMLGRRSPMQHRVIRNAEEAWSQFAAELNLSNAQTQAQRNENKKTRAPHRNGKPSTSEGAAGPVKVTSRADATTYVEQMAATLLGFSNKHAKLLPAAYGTAVQRFKADINKDATEEQEGSARR